MKNKRKRPVYRRNSETYYKIYPDGTFISAMVETLFEDGVIRKGNAVKEDKNMKTCLKKEFIKRYRQARKAIRL